jgi:hypothetical protein
MNAWYYIDAWRKGAKNTWGINPNWAKVDSYGPVRTSEENSLWWEQHFLMEYYPNNIARRYLWDGANWILQKSVASLSGASNETATLVERE